MILQESVKCILRWSNQKRKPFKMNDVKDWIDQQNNPLFCCKRMRKLNKSGWKTMVAEGILKTLLINHRLAKWTVCK